MTGFGRALAHLRKIADGKGHTKGKLFEKLTRSFLKTYPLYVDRFEEVWLWKDYPKRNGRKDFGVDLVAKEKDGSLCAIQCKFYDSKTLTKSDIDSFLEASSRSEFHSMMLFYSGMGYGREVERALAGHGCQVINFESLASSNIDWPDLVTGLTKIKRKEPYKLWDHQRDALDGVMAGLGKVDRGQLIMACGTGKTLTSLRIAERMVNKGGLVLYAVPSISLMHQAIRYWSEHRTIPHSYVGVCSDPKVSHGEKTDIPIIEMEIGVTTDPARIASVLKQEKGAVTVVFATYHSMGAVVEAQEIAKVPFDLVLCDEAHRTTGIEGRSSFTLVHKDENIKARKRIYMTATPRIYKAASKTRAKRADDVLYSMDDVSVYGRVFYELNFSDSIDLKLLSDYKVIILGVDERYATGPLQKMIDTATEAGGLNLTDAARMLGYFRVLENPNPNNSIRSLQTSIAYTNRIWDSQTFAKTFTKLTLEANPDSRFNCNARHVDGTQNASVRADALQWLRDSSANPNECLILSNARCLSEGVDVPALDSICFLNPKSSPVEIVQAVGRVMRKAEGKEYGYVIIPIGVPPDEKSETVLDNNRVFDQVWDILRAMRSHDSDLGIEADIASLRRELPKKTKLIGVDRNGNVREQKDPKTIPLGELDVPADMLYSKIVEEVGDRRYLEHWAKDVADVVLRIQERIGAVVSNGSAKARFDSYMTSLRDIIHDGLSESEGVEMLAQHMVTRRIFNAMFGPDFARQNPVSVALDNVVEELRLHGLDAELEGVEDFYKSIENRVAKLDNHNARQQVISELYGTFFKKAFPKMADRLGIVYTPTEVVDFILRSVDYALSENFGRGLTDRGVNIIDPFTGAGTFIARMMSNELALIRDVDLERKYGSEIFASEIVLLAYYIAAVNCESAYGQRTSIFEQFTGLSLTDTFNPGKLLETSDDMMVGPKRRILRQRAAKITAVVGNPPYSAGQKSANENNKNVKHPILEARVASTYVKMAPKGNKVSLYNSYIKALRWASDRIGESGVIGFITPSAWITGNAEAGIRACLAKEFTDVWVYDLRGDVKKSDWRKEGDKIFGGGSTVGVAITILAKNPAKEGCAIHYKDIGDYLSRNDKLRIVREFASINGIRDWTEITPDKHHDWLNQRGQTDEAWELLPPMGSKEGKAHKTDHVLFRQYSNGLKTHRDAWVYNTSKKELAKNMKRHIDYCNTQDPGNFIIDAKQAVWNAELARELKKLAKKPKFDRKNIRIAMFRPFFKQLLYFDPVFVAAKYQIPKFFPRSNDKNLAIMVPDKTNGEFSTLVTDNTPDLQNVMNGQVFPFRAKKQNRENVRPVAPPASSLQPPASSLQPPAENLTIIVPDKIKGEFSVFITDMTPDLHIMETSQVFPLKVTT